MPHATYDEIDDGFGFYKQSAVSKLKLITSYVKNVTIGPNRTIIEDEPSTVYNNAKPAPTQDYFSNTSMHCNTTIIINNLQNELNYERQRECQKALNERINYIKEFSQQQQEDYNRRLKRRQQLLINEQQQQELLILQALEQHDKDMTLQHQQLQLYYQELAERNRKIDIEFQEQEKRKKLVSLIIDNIKKDQSEFGLVYKELLNCIKSFKYPNELKAELGEVIKQLQKLPEGMEEVVLRCKTWKVSEADCHKTQQIVNEIKGILEVVQRKAALIAEQIERKPEIKQAPLLIKQIPQPVILSVPTPAPVLAPTPAPVTTLTVTPPTPITEPNKSIELASLKLDKFVSKSSLRLYAELQDFLEKYTQSFKELNERDSFKQFRFHCKKAVNIPVNAISAVSSQHLLDKYHRLSNLLQGKTVEIGESRISAGKHPQGISFCTNLLAKKFILQGDLMISSNPEAAFSYSAIIVALWNEFPDFGRLVLAYFYKQCPYLVPMYPPHTVEQTDEDYYRSLGYQYSDGVVEKQDKFLKRMTGIMRLYAAILIEKPKDPRKQNSHDLACGWRWLSAFLNLEPLPDITATILHVFLEIAGWTFQNAYGKVFMKLMYFICQVYLPKIKQIDSGGPVSRLEVLLNEYMQKRYFDPPRGLLTNKIL